MKITSKIPLRIPFYLSVLPSDHIAGAACTDMEPSVSIFLTKTIFFLANDEG